MTEPALIQTGQTDEQGSQCRRVFMYKCCALCCIVLMATHVQDILRTVGSFLTWRELASGTRVNSDYRQAFARTTVIQSTAPKENLHSSYRIHAPRGLRSSGLYVYLTPWERNCVVWTPFFSVDAIIERGKKYIIPRRAVQDRAWKQWLMRLVATLQLAKIHPYITGKGVVYRRSRLQRALITFRIRNQTLDMRVLKLSPARRI